MELVHVKGLDELARNLKALPTKIARKAFRAGVSAGAKLIQDDYKARIASRTGTLRRSVVRKFIRELSNDQQVVMYVTPRKGKKLRRVSKSGKSLNADAYYASWVEFGHLTRPAVLRQIKRGRGRDAAVAKMVSSGAVRSVPGRRWLTQSFESNKMKAIEVMRERIAESLRDLPEFGR